MFLGLTDLILEGQFLWQTDYSELEYTNWYEGYPTSDDERNCAVKDGKSYGEQWVDLDCEDTWHGLCEKPSGN